MMIALLKQVSHIEIVGGQNCHLTIEVWKSLKSLDDHTGIVILNISKQMQQLAFPITTNCLLVLSFTVVLIVVMITASSLAYTYYSVLGIAIYEFPQADLPKFTAERALLERLAWHHMGSKVNDEQLNSLVATYSLEEWLTGNQS